MDEETATTEYSELEEAIAETPEEIQDFVWSDAFQIIIKGIQKIIGLPPEQTLIVKNGAENLILGIEDMPAIEERFLKSGMSEEVVAKVLYAIENEVVSRAENINEFYSEDNETTPAESAFSVTPTDILESLKNRFVEPKTIAPAVREHTDRPIDGIVKKEASTASLRIDPYRETPE